MLKTLWNLVVALLNATLILLALCLFLGLKVADRANDIAATFASNLIRLEPLKDEVAAARGDMAALKAEIAALKDAPGDLAQSAVQSIEARMDKLNGRIEGMQQTVDEVRQMPYDLTDYAITRAASELGDTVSSITRARQSAE